MKPSFNKRFLGLTAIIFFNSCGDNIVDDKENLDNFSPDSNVVENWNSNKNDERKEYPVIQYDPDKPNPDFNLDGFVDEEDFFIFADNYGTTEENKCDLDKDLDVDEDDLEMFKKYYRCRVEYD